MFYFLVNVNIHHKQCLTHASDGLVSHQIELIEQPLHAHGHLWLIDRADVFHAYRLWGFWVSGVPTPEHSSDAHACHLTSPLDQSSLDHAEPSLMDPLLDGPYGHPPRALP
jgi:hypothetical protein